MAFDGQQFDKLAINMPRGIAQHILDVIDETTAAVDAHTERWLNTQMGRLHAKHFIEDIEADRDIGASAGTGYLVDYVAKQLSGPRVIDGADGGANSQQ